MGKKSSHSKIFTLTPLVALATNMRYEFSKGALYPVWPTDRWVWATFDTHILDQLCHRIYLQTLFSLLGRNDSKQGFENWENLLFGEVKTTNWTYSLTLWTWSDDFAKPLFLIDRIFGTGCAGVADIAWMAMNDKLKWITLAPQKAKFAFL